MARASSGKSNRSLGEQLRERRILLEISLDELSRRSGVASKYLRWVEKEEWSLLPGGVYTKGILRRYAQVVGEDPERLVKEFEETVRRKTERKGKEKKLLRGISGFSPRFFRFLAGVVVLLALLGYIVYQLSPVLARPELTLEKPLQVETVVRQDNVVLAGRTERGASLFLNDQPLALDDDGRFETTIELLPGLNVLEVKAVSRFGKETIEERKIIFIEEING